MKPNPLPTLAAVLITPLLVSPRAARAQDLYDPTVLRTFHITFHDANWLTLLRQNYASETPILADLVVDGVTYPNVGVRIRGNTSYTALPAGSEKFSLKIDMDFVDSNQELMGYDTLNLNNGFRDPTFCREVVYNNYVAQFIPNPRANHVLVTLNGANWGVYVNVQQPDKRMLRDYFANADGLRIRCPNNPNGPGLRYNGASPSGYTGYEIQTDGGLADPWAALIAVCNSVTNEPLATWPNIDTLFAIDPSIWSVVLENMLTDDDSYVNKGSDFMTYRDPIDGRTHLLQRDANETFTQSSWSPTLNFTASNKPVLSHVLAVAELRQRYMSHYRVARVDLTWDYFGPIFTAHRNLIDAAVQADPKKLYSYTLFQNNFTSTVNMPYPGLAGGNIIGLQQFVTQRATFLNSNAELSASGPTISLVQASNSAPAPGEPVVITASVVPAGNPVSKVELFYRPSASGVYQRVLMTNSGAGQYSVQLPISGAPGQRVAYYVAATAANAYNSLAFFPALSERGPLTLTYTLSSAPGMRITEWMYSGASGEFIEFTNMSAGPIDMTGWSMDDDHAVPGAFSLGAFGVVQPGESVLVTENNASAFRTAWGLGPQVKIIGQLGAVTGNNLGRNDQIHLYNQANELVDQLFYGDQTYPNTIRTQNRSGQACPGALGQNTVSAWQLATAGDGYGSFAASSGDVGSPGFYAPPVASISAHPAHEVVCPADTAQFTVVAAGAGTLVYQWQIESAPPGSNNYSNLANGPIGGSAAVASGTATPTLAIQVNGDHSISGTAFRCIVSATCGGETSNPASLVVWTSCSPADLDCDGTLGPSDAAAMVLAVLDPDAYATAHPGCPMTNGDMNHDGAIDGLDLQEFVIAILAG